MTFAQLRYLCYTDLYRYTGRGSLRAGLRCYLRTPGFKYTVWMRTTAYLRRSRPRWLTRPLALGAQLVMEHWRYRFGISIPADTRIGPGLYIGHFGGIVVSRDTVIGRNCNLSQGVTLGRANRGKNTGDPVIGDNVYLGPGAKVIGAVRVGSNAAIGANCVVTHDVPENAVVVGVPGRVISYEGARGYVERTDYAPLKGGSPPASA